MLCLRGCWTSPSCPHTYPHAQARPKQGPFPRPRLSRGVSSTTSPSDSLPARAPLRRRLIGVAASDVDRRVGPLLFRIRLSPHALLSTPGTSCTPPVLTGAVCCLRREMSGSAIPSLSGVYLTGLQGSLDVGPTALLPSQEPHRSLRALDAPLGRRDLAPRLEPATRRSGAYRDGTLTRKSDTARRSPRRAGIFRTHHCSDCRGNRGKYGALRPNT